MNNIVKILVCQCLSHNQRNYLQNHVNLSPTTNFTLFTLEELADDNFKFDENGIMFFKQEENTVGKGEIARYCEDIGLSMSEPLAEKVLAKLC